MPPSSSAWTKRPPRRSRPSATLPCASASVWSKTARASGFVTAGNTGAAMVTAKMVLGVIPGVDRPALATVFPTAANTATIMLDVGANVDCKPHNLQQFAIMGDIYFRSIFSGRFPTASNPRVGLLSVGEEETKGNELTRERLPAHQAARPQLPRQCRRPRPLQRTRRRHRLRWLCGQRGAQGQRRPGRGRARHSQRVAAVHPHPADGLSAGAARLRGIQEAPGLFRVRRSAAARRQGRRHCQPRLLQRHRHQERHPRGRRICPLWPQSEHRRGRSSAARDHGPPAEYEPLAITFARSHRWHTAFPDSHFSSPARARKPPAWARNLLISYAAARRIFEEADEALGYSLSKLCFEGPGRKTPAYRNHPAGDSHRLRRRRPRAARAGHRAQLCRRPFPGRILRPRRRRHPQLCRCGAYRAQSRPVHAGGRAGRRGRHGRHPRSRHRTGPRRLPRGLRRITGEVCEPANINSPGQVVISGAKAAVERAAELCKHKGAKRAIMLPVSAPFHCSTDAAGAGPPGRRPACAHHSQFPRFR